MDTEALKPFCLAACLCISLFLPFYAKAVLRKRKELRRPVIALVWAGQGCLGLGGLLIVMSPHNPFIGLAVAMTSGIVFGFLIRRQIAIVSKASSLSN